MGRGAGRGEIEVRRVRGGRDDVNLTHSTMDGQQNCSKRPWG